jgi:hypothetical protein
MVSPRGLWPPMTVLHSPQAITGPPISWGVPPLIGRRGVPGACLLPVQLLIVALQISHRLSHRLINLALDKSGHHLVLKGGCSPGITHAIHGSWLKAESWLINEGRSPILYTQLWPSEGSLVGWWPLTSLLAQWPLYCTITEWGGGGEAGWPEWGDRYPVYCRLLAVQAYGGETVFTCQQYYYIYEIILFSKGSC